MPCTLPLGDVSGVFRSAWASIHSMPMGLPAAEPGTVPMLTE